MITLKELTMDVEYKGEQVDSSGWEHHLYEVALHRDGRTMATPFKMGLALTEEPSLERVMECLFLDSSTVENARDFSDWCEEFGYSDDSIVALETYNLCKGMAKQLRNLLEEDYDEYEELYREFLV
jgi:hypothetical protein